MSLISLAAPACSLAFQQGLNQFFYFRYPSVTILGIVAQLLTFPLGQAWARFLPNVKVFGLSLNPGPFSIKEHVLITIMASVGAQSAYATDIVAVQRVFYGQIYNFSCMVIFLLVIWRCRLTNVF
jgi:hypothetical protein